MTEELTPPTGPPSGWYPDPQQEDTLRYWNGTSWTEQTRPDQEEEQVDLISLAESEEERLTPEREAEIMNLIHPPPTADQRRDLLNAALAIEMLPGTGWRIESQTDYRAVLVRGREPNRILHLILTIITVGLWLLIWLPIEMFKIGFPKRKLVWVDEDGNVRTNKQ